MKNKVLRPLEFLSFKEFEHIDTTPDEADMFAVAYALALDMDYDNADDYI